jgi:hypothetical protein
VLGHHGSHLDGRQGKGEGVQHFDWVVRGRPALERGVQVGYDDVVGLDRLKATGFQPLPVGLVEDQRRCRVPHRAVGVRRPALEFGRRLSCSSRASAVGVIGRHDLGVVDASHDGVGVQALNTCQRCAQGVGIVEGAGRRELRELQSAQRGLFERRCRQSGGHDRTARRGCGTQPGLGRDLKRHSEPAESLVANRRSRGRVAAGCVLTGVLGEPDHHQRPAQLLAIAPLQGRVGRPCRVSPRAARVGEMGDVDHRVIVAVGLGRRQGCTSDRRRMLPGLGIFPLAPAPSSR